ncbi:hypothetical protein WMF37_14450 [Sorangium sp. So ce291]|uniref:hypothetical protein n=1 Tax=Sorangium sp. So ce291 TaxID=3133294 RepID=UPI003F5FCC4E
MSGDPSVSERALQQPASSPEEAIDSRGTAGDALVPSATVSLSSGRRYMIEAAPSGDRLVVRGRDGELVLQMEITDAGPVLSFSAPNGERAGSRWGAWGAESSVPPRRATCAPQSGILPLASAKGHPSEGDTDEAVQVPRAMPLPTIKLPPDAELLELDGGSARSGVTLRRPRDELGEGGAAPAALARSGSTAPEPASQRDAVDDRRERRERRELPSLSLQQYAALCAESSVGAASSFDQALLRHGIADRDLWKAVDTSWQDRLEREPILTLRWMELTARYREHITRR